jgi:AcrR family transcriptional regulator
MSDGAPIGLRERKKLMTRRTIVEVAQAMFTERGFDGVTVAEIADAATISPKTVFTYFATKEDLVFEGENEVRDAIVAGIRERAPGTTPLDAMRDYLEAEMSSAGTASVAHLHWLHRVIGDTPSLRARMRLMWERFEDAVAEELAAEAGQDLRRPEHRVAAAQLVLVYRLLASSDVLAYLRSRPTNKQRAAFANWLDVSLRLVADGIGDYGVRAV